MIRDGFSGVMQAFPLTSKDHHSVKECLLKFVGTHEGEVQTICKSDCGKDLFRATTELGWLPESSFPRRGDAVRGDGNQAAVFDEIVASAPTSLGGLNLIVAYGLWDGNETTTSDCINAYVQSILSSSQPTYVLLPIELVPDHAKHTHQPCAPLINHCMVIRWPVHLGTTISPKSLRTS